MVERILFSPGGATEANQDEVISALGGILTELQQKLEAGQSVSLDAGTLAALESVNAQVSGTITSEDSGEREYSHVVATVTNSGLTTIHTPASGKSIRLVWFYAVNDPTATTSTLIDVRLGVRGIYRAWAISKRQRVTGAVNAPLTVTLSNPGTVAVTAIFEEV